MSEVIIFRQCVNGNCKAKPHYYKYGEEANYFKAEFEDINYCYSCGNKLMSVIENAD